MWHLALCGREAAGLRAGDVISRTAAALRAGREGRVRRARMSSRKEMCSATGSDGREYMLQVVRVAGQLASIRSSPTGGCTGHTS